VHSAPEFDATDSYNYSIKAVSDFSNLNFSNIKRLFLNFNST